MPDNQAPLDDLDLLQPAAPPAASQEPTAEPNQPPTLPDKYRGKTIEDLIEMHQNAERRLSQQGNELGEMRRIADGIIGIKQRDNATRPTPQPRAPVTVEKLLENPEQALTSTIEQSTVAQRTNAVAQRVEALEANVAKTRFESAYPDYQQDMNNPEFLEWVRKNPVRSQLGQAAYQGNYEAATGLWSLWQEAKGSQAPAPSAGREAARAARVQRQGASGEQPAKVYSREKLMQLRERVQNGDSAAVAQWNRQDFQNALIQAYAEGRVR